jgi:Sulfotransferase family
MTSPGDLLEAAVAKTGLDDFGDDSFREGFEILVAGLNDEARLNARGEAFVFSRISLHLQQRLQVEDWYRRHPEIEGERIDAPVFGMGLPRTGSTALSFLMAKDPAIRYLHSWESAEPCPPPSTVEGDDPRIPPGAIQLLVGSKHHVPDDINGPMECLDLMALDFKSQIFQAFAQIPTYSEWLVERADFTSTYAYERRVLKLLQWGQPTRPWRLKSPSHVLSLDYLDAVFPDARFVMTHRDPTEVMLSVADVYADIVGGFSDHVDRRYLGELNVGQWSAGMERVCKFRSPGQAGDADGRFFDIDFRSMAADPIGEIRALYGWLGEPVTEDFEMGMRAWWEHNSENREPSAKGDLADYGLDPDHMRPRFASYVEHAQRWTSKERSADVRSKKGPRT